MRRALSLAVLALAAPAFAGTTAYWRFELGPADAQLDHLADADNKWSADVPDSSGNGNALSAFTDGAWGGHAYKSDVATPVIPSTGAANNFSVKNTGGYPGMWNESLANWTPAQWTIEATFKPENGGYRTIVGRDSKGAGKAELGADPNASALYFQLQPENRVAVTFQDVMGFQYSAVSEKNAVQGFDFPADPNGLAGKWYSMAGVSDGTTLSVYLNDLAAGTGYQLVAHADLTLSGSTDTSLTAGLGSANDWSHGNFSVGRGLYNGGHGDRAYGFIDEVRITEGALSPSEFLMVPEPGTATLLVAGLAGLALARRRVR